MLTLQRLTKTCALGAALLLAQTALAGPPLICHPFLIVDAPALPWTDAPHWHAPAPGYDVGRLTADTLALLDERAPILARMENVRRATIYAALDERVATELLRTLLARASGPASSTRAAALALFDAGYLVESYRQMDLARQHGMLGTTERRGMLADAPDTDGYALVRRAIELAPGDAAEMEFAASLMTTDKPALARHRGAAAAGAMPGSLLALNIEHFGQ